MPIFRVKSVKIYTGQKNLHWRRQWRQWQLSGMVVWSIGCNRGKRHQVGSRQATIKLTFLWLSCTVSSDYSSTSLNVVSSTRFFAISLFFFWTSCPTQTDTRLFEISVFYSWTDTRFCSSEPPAPHKLRGCLLKCEVTLQLSPSWWHLGLPPFGQDLCPRIYLGIFFFQKIQKYCSDFRKITVVWFWH